MTDTDDQLEAAETSVVAGASASTASKDQLMLAMLAVMGGEHGEVNERDLFLACWHAFPNAMRWANTSLPNPDTFTAALRRLDAHGLINRSGKTQRDTRRKRKASARRASALETGRSGVVKASVATGALDKARLTPEMLDEVQALRIPEEQYLNTEPVSLMVTCIHLRQEADRHLDEGALVETAFHRFPAVFAYSQRPEWPDIQRAREAISTARDRGLISSSLALTEKGRALVGRPDQQIGTRLDPSAPFAAPGTLRFAERVEKSEGYIGWMENRSLARTKRDELFRILRVPPTTDAKPVADALAARRRDLFRVDKGALADYLLRIAERWNPEAAAVLAAREEGAQNGVGVHDV
jgi:hypothetical protein